MNTLLAAFVIDGKNLIEFIIGILGIIGAISSVSIYLATLGQKQLMGVDLARLAARFQRLLDRDRVQLGALQMKFRDMESFMQSKHGYNPRQDFPSESLPDEDTDFNG